MSISAIPPAAAAAIQPAAGAKSAGGAFTESLQKVLSSVDETSADANDAIAKMLDGTGDVHAAMIALQRADITMQLTVQIKNKLVQAYQDVMRMTI